MSLSHTGRYRLIDRIAADDRGHLNKGVLLCRPGRFRVKTTAALSGERLRAALGVCVALMLAIGAIPSGARAQDSPGHAPKPVPLRIKRGLARDAGFVAATLRPRGSEASPPRPHSLSRGGPRWRFATSSVSNPPTTPAEEDSPALLGEPSVLRTGIDWVSRRLGDGEDGTVKSGFYPEFGNMITGSGWIALGPGYRQRLFDGQALIDGSAAVSWRGYKMTQGRFELSDLAGRRLAVGSQAMWRDFTQLTYFGAGADSLESERSEYRVHGTDVVAYATVRPTGWLAVGGRFGWLGRPTLSSPTGPFARGNPDTRQVFPDDEVYALAEQPSFLRGEVSVAADTRDHRGYPSSGGLYRVEWERYADRDTGRFGFDRYELEAAQFLSVIRDLCVVALHGWAVLSDTADGRTVPFYLMPSLGGNNTLRGYTDYRFHDRNLLVVNAEARWALFTHVDAVAFIDAGSVASRIGDLDVAKRSYGGGIRVHTHTSTIGRLDVGHSREGWRLFFRLNDPFRLKRLSRRTAALPFAP